MEGGKRTNSPSAADGYEKAVAALTVLSNIVLQEADAPCGNRAAWDTMAEPSLSTPVMIHDVEGLETEFERNVGSHQQTEDFGDYLGMEFPIPDVCERDFRSEKSNSEMAVANIEAVNHAKRPRLDNGTSLSNVQSEPPKSNLGQDNAETLNSTFNMGDFIVFNDPSSRVRSPNPQVAPSQPLSPVISSRCRRSVAFSRRLLSSQSDNSVEEIVDLTTPPVTDKGRVYDESTGTVKGKSNGKAKMVKKQYKNKVGSMDYKSVAGDGFVVKTGPSIAKDEPSATKSSVNIKGVSAQVTIAHYPILTRLLELGKSKPVHQNPPTKPEQNQGARIVQVVNAPTFKKPALPALTPLSVSETLPEPSTSGVVPEVGRSSTRSPDLFENEGEDDIAAAVGVTRTADDVDNYTVDAFSQEGERNIINTFFQIYTDLGRKRAAQQREVETAVDELEIRRQTVVRRRAHLRRIESLIDPELLRQLRNAEKQLKISEEDARYSEIGVVAKRRVYDGTFAKVHAIKSRMLPPSP